ncbi:MAG: hypothetical protein ACPGTU_00080 [Myxococcota bacterium]
MRPECLLLVVMGCAYPDPDCADQYERNDKGTCIVVEQSASSDTNDPGLDTPSGTYSGPIEISIVANADGIVIEDSCAGVVAFELEGDQIFDGSVTCAFADGGTVAVIIGSDPFVGTIAGSVGDGDTAGGDFYLDLGSFGELDTTWSGDLKDNEVSGDLGGQFNYVLGALEVPVDYVGSFTSSR